MQLFRRMIKEEKSVITIVMITFTVVIVFALLYKSAGLYYGINDDTTMQSLASGAVTGMPDGHLIFIKYPLGVVVAGLFKLSNQYDWYGITLVGCMLMCYVLCFHRVILTTRNRENGTFIRVICFLLIVPLFVGSTIIFQFTIVAGMLGATAIFYLASLTKKIRLADYILVWALLLLTAMLRIKVFYMVVPLCAFFLVRRIVENVGVGESQTVNECIERFKACRRGLTQISVVTIVGVLLFSGIMFLEKRAYADEPWSTYKQYIHSRSLIMDYYGWPAYEGNVEFWDSIDISAEEYACIWMYGILPNIDEEKIVMIADYSQELSRRNTSLDKRLHSMWTVFKKAVKEYNCRIPNILLLAAIGVLVIYAGKADHFTRLRIVVGAMIELAILLYLLYQGRLPERIIMIYDYQCILAVMGSVLAHCGFAGLRNKIGKVLLMLICTGLLIATSYRTNKDVLEYKEKLRIHAEEVSYVSNYEDRVFVVPNGTFVSAKQFTIHERSKSINTVGTRGWSVYSPWNEIKYQSYGLGRNSHILLQPNVYMLTADLAYADNLNQYYRSLGVIDSDYSIEETHTFSDGGTVYYVEWNSGE